MENNCGRLGCIASLCLMSLACITTSVGLTQQAPAPVVTPPQPASAQVAGTPAPTPVAPELTSLQVYPLQTQVIQNDSASTTSSLLLAIKGTGFDSVDMSKFQVIPFPGVGVTVTSFVLSTDKTTIFAQLTAPVGYSLSQISYTFDGKIFKPRDTGTSSCDFQHQVILTPQIVPHSDVKTKYGNGIGSHFHVIQISVVNKCSMPVVVPLGGIAVYGMHLTGDNAMISTPTSTPKKAKQDRCSRETPNDELVPFSLDHLTSIYSEDRKLTGTRAVYFNSLQALATIGSAIEPYFASGFTQGVAILGGGFTTASKEIFVDMSAEQLQNLTSQSFGVTEQVASNGSLQKFIFIRRFHECEKTNEFEAEIAAGKLNVKYELLPGSSAPPTTQTVQATVAPAGK